MQATLSEQELIQVAINREKASFALYSRAAVQAASVTISNIADQTGLRERYISLHG